MWVAKLDTERRATEEHLHPWIHVLCDCTLFQILYTSSNEPAMSPHFIKNNRSTFDQGVLGEVSSFVHSYEGGTRSGVLMVTQNNI